MATAEQPMFDLTPFEAQRVARTKVAVTNAGDGLSEAMAVDPVELHIGDEVYIVLAATVSKVRFEEIKDSTALARIHVLRAGTASLVDESIVADYLAKQRSRIEEAQGVIRLPMEEG